MGKILSWIALFALVYAGMRLFVLFQRKSQAAALARARRAQDADGQGGGRDAGDGAQGKSLGESMLACANCGVYAPASEMLRARGRVYCSAEHRDADGA